MLEDTYGHTPVRKAFEQLDVYGIGYDEARATGSPVRLGIIGAGGVAQSKYFPAIARLRMIWEPIEVVAFSEPREDHGRKVEAIYSGKWYADYQVMLAEADLDGVLVLGPDDRHLEHTLASLEAGHHVLVEKPITRSLAGAQQMCQVAEEHGLILMVVANKRYSPPYRRAKQAISSGAVHDPALFVGKFNFGYDYVDLFESGTIHLFDITRYLMGDVVAVNAVGVSKYGRNRRKYPVDNAVVTLEFTSGAVGTIYTSSSALNLKPWERVEVYGNHAWLAVEDQHELLVYDSEEGPTQSWRTVIPNTLLFDEEFGGYMGILENFAQCIRGKDKPLVTGWDGYRAYELLTAVELSLISHSRITLPLTDPKAADDDVKVWLQANGWPGES